MRGLEARLTIWVVVTAGALALLVSAAVVVLVGGPARSVDPAPEPYGGCAEAWQAPRSPGAQQCRELGWTISARFVVGPRGVVRHSSLPHCAHEDGSGGPRPCTWNIARPADGNGRGLAYMVRRDFSARYVWASSPTGAGWRWVDESLARRLARRFTRPGDRRSTAAWQRCVVRYGDTTRIRCPEGRRYVF
jgi:hypothetical protein